MFFTFGIPGLLIEFMWIQMDADWTRWIQMDPDGSRWAQMGQMGPDGPTWWAQVGLTPPRLGPDGPRWAQVGFSPPRLGPDGPI